MIWERHTEANGMTVKVKIAQLCLILCDPMDCSLLGSSAVGFSRPEYWSGYLFPPPGDLPAQIWNQGLPHGRWLPSETPGKHRGGGGGRCAGRSLTFVQKLSRLEGKGSFKLLVPKAQRWEQQDAELGCAASQELL